MGNTYLTNFRYKVYIGSSCYGFSRVSGLREEVEYDSVQEGGRNWSPLLFVKGNSKAGTLVLERGTVAGDEHAVLKRGARLYGVVILAQGIEPGDYFSYGFDAGIVMKVEYGDLDAMGHDILIRKVEIAHSGLEQIIGED